MYHLVFISFVLWLSYALRVSKVRIRLQATATAAARGIFELEGRRQPLIRLFSMSCACLRQTRKAQSLLPFMRAELGKAYIEDNHGWEDEPETAAAGVADHRSPCSRLGAQDSRIHLVFICETSCVRLNVGLVVVVWL